MYVMASDIAETPQAIGSLPPTQPSVASTTRLNQPNDLNAQFYRTWQPTGIRISVKLPYISDDATPLFAVRVTPRVGLLGYRDVTMAGTTKTVHGQGYTNPIVYPSCGKDRPAYPAANEPVVATIYDSAGPFNKMAHMYRYYKGTINYRFRCITNFVAQGYVIFGVVHGAIPDILTRTGAPDNPQGCRYLIRRVWNTADSVKAGMMNNYVLTDLSQYRHVEVSVPFISNSPYRDMQWLDAVTSSAVDNGDESVVINQPQSFIVAYARGELTSFSGTEATLTYELEYCPGEDFEFFNELPLTVSTLFVTKNLEKRQKNSNYRLPFIYPNGTASPATREAKETNETHAKHKEAVRDEGLVLRMNAMTLARNVARRSMHEGE